MTIEVFTGFPGAGKSFAATKTGVNVADAKLSNKWVIANFPIKNKKTLFSRFRKKKEVKSRWIFEKNENLTVDYLIEKSLENKWNEKEGSALVIIDEASLLFNSRDWNSADRKQWTSFLPQHRKFGYDIILITQDVRTIDKQIRGLIEYEVQHKKLNNMPFLGWISLFGITLFAAVSFWNGTKYGKGNLKLYIYRKSVANRYDTLNLFDYGT